MRHNGIDLLLTDADPLARWNHPNHVAGYLADIAVAVGLRGVVDGYYRAAKATSRAARRAWNARARQDFAAHWGRLTGKPLAAVHTFSGSDIHHDYVRLVVVAGRILALNQYRAKSSVVAGDLFVVRRAEVDYLGSRRAWPILGEDHVSDLEIRWRIRDWLSLCDDVTNIPPNPRLAAAAAWRIGARKTAFEIVVGAAAEMVDATQHRRR